MALLSTKAVITNAVQDYTRPDLFPRMQSRLLSYLREAHGADEYKQDLVRYEVTTFTRSTDGVVVLSASTSFPSLRDLKAIETYQTYNQGTTPTTLSDRLDTNFMEGLTGKAPVNYFGFTPEKYWASAGDYITIKGVSANASIIIGYASAWPSLILNEAEDQYYSNSWILAKFPEVIEARIAKQVASICGDRTRIQVANTRYAEARHEFKRMFDEDIYHGSEPFRYIGPHRY